MKVIKLIVCSGQLQKECEISFANNETNPSNIARLPAGVLSHATLTHDFLKTLSSIYKPGPPCFARSTILVICLPNFVKLTLKKFGLAIKFTPTKEMAPVLYFLYVL